MIANRLFSKYIFSLPLSVGNLGIKSCEGAQIKFAYKSFHEGRIEPSTKFLKIDCNVGQTTREIAYKKSDGPRKTGVVYIPGFMSKMNGGKANALEGFCQQYGFNYIRYDAAGLGESKSMSLETARLTHWMHDADQVLNLLTSGPQIVVGSSMGGWITLYLAQKYPEKFKGILLLAPGVNFAKRFVDKYKKSLPKSIVKELEEGKVFYLPHPEYGTFPVSLHLIEDMYQYELDMQNGIEVACPIRIIHGLQDEDVPYDESLNLLQCVSSKNAELLFIKNGKHRLSEDSDLELICDTILRLDKITSREKSS